MIGQKQDNRYCLNNFMANEDGITEKKIIDFLKKNKNFFIKNSDLVKDLNFPLSDNSSDKVIDLEAYRYKKISQQNIEIGRAHV